MPRVLALTVVLAVMLAGCGGGGKSGDTSDSAQITSVTSHYFAAVGSGNGLEACALLTAAARARLRHGTSCPALVGAARSTLSPQARAAFANVEVSDPAITGARATVQARTASRTQKVVLIKSSGRWLIETVGPGG